MERLRHQPRRAERVSVLSKAMDLPRYDRVISELVAAERAEGWLARCHDEGRYLVPTEELVDEMVRLLVGLGDGPVVEICAGDGSLARALRSGGVGVIATDVSPSVRRPWEVRTLAAHEALDRYRPRVVIGSFVPVDADVDRRVLADPDVRHYLVFTARIGHDDGSRPDWDRPGWSRKVVPELTRWLITRHDGWMGEHLPVLRRGEAWLLSRTPAADGDAAFLEEGPS